MAADQQFCLKWNNHTTTLVSVFDTLLEKESLVDCTLAAEGQFIKAHKVVLSACSPYFELLLSQHYDKHPIVVLKDVQFYELRAILDYMYRGEVNISQDQLASLLKVAESLQIKGLSGNENDGPPEKKQENRKSVSRPLPSGHSEPKKTAVNNLSGPSETPPLTPKPIVRDDRMSPVPRKRKKRPNSLSDDSSSSALQDGLEVSSSNELPSHSQPVPSVSNLNIPPAFTNVPVSTKPKTMTPVTTPVKERAEPEFRPSPQTSRYNTPTKSAPPAVPIETVVVPKLEKLEPPTDTLIEPKAEIIDEKEDDIEDLTLDDDEEYDMEAGPSNAGDESNQDYGWSQEDAMLAAQQAGGNQRDSQDDEVDEMLEDPRDDDMDPLDTEESSSYSSDDSEISLGMLRELAWAPGMPHHCKTCGRTYRSRESLTLHQTAECGRESTYSCSLCDRSFKGIENLSIHFKQFHGNSE